MVGDVHHWGPFGFRRWTLTCCGFAEYVVEQRMECVGVFHQQVLLLLCVVST